MATTAAARTAPGVAARAPGGAADVERTADGRRHLLAVDSLRGICACLVTLYHFGSDGWLASTRLIAHAYLFVDLFFVLSGFVIANAYRAKLAGGMPAWRFMGLRAGRLYPLHLLILLGLLALQLPGIVAHGWSEAHPLGGLVVTLLLLQVFTANGAGDWNAPSWSISAEFWTYLLFAGLCRWGRRLFWPVLLVAVVAMPFVLLHATDRYINACFTGALARCVYGFGVGVLCSAAWRRYGARIGSLGRPLLTAVELVAVTAAGLFVIVAGAGPWSLACPWLFAPVVLALAIEGGAVSALLKRAPFVFVGTLSYSIYMVHEPIQGRFYNLLSWAGLGLAGTTRAGAHPVSRDWPVPFASDLLTLAMLGLTILVAWGTFRLIEEPGRIASRRWFAGRRAAR